MLYCVGVTFPWGRLQIVAGGGARIGQHSYVDLGVMQRQVVLPHAALSSSPLGAGLDAALAGLGAMKSAPCAKVGLPDSVLVQTLSLPGHELGSIF